MVRDHGPNGLWATMVNFVAPNYGFVAGVRRTGLVFNGTTQRLTLPLSFYDHVSSAGLTVITFARHAAPAANDVLFSCRDAGATRGWLCECSTADRLRLLGYTAGGVALSSTDSVDVPLAGRTWVHVLSFDQVSASNLHMHSTRPLTGTIAGSTAVIGYDATVVPTIGCTPGGGGQFFDGTLWHFSVWPWRMTHPEALDMTRMILDGVV